VAEAESLAFGEDTDDIRRTGEVDPRRPDGLGLVFGPRRILLVELQYLLPCEGRRLGLHILPSIDADEGHTQS